MRTLLATSFIAAFLSCVLVEAIDDISVNITWSNPFKSIQTNPEIDGDELFQCLLDSFMQEEARKVRLDIEKWSLENEEQLKFLDEMKIDSTLFSSFSYENMDTIKEFKAFFHITTKEAN